MLYRGVAQDEAIMRALDIIRHPFVWPGGYELLPSILKIAVMDDGEVLCKDCVKNNLALIARADEGDEWHIARIDIAENCDCANCGKVIKVDL